MAWAEDKGSWGQVAIELRGSGALSPGDRWLNWRGLPRNIHVRWVWTEAKVEAFFPLKQDKENEEELTVTDNL